MSVPDVVAPGAAAPMDCETAVRRLWDYLDRRLPAVTADEVEAHLAACERCPPHFAFARRMQAAVAAARASALPGADGDNAALRARVQAALRRQGASE